MNWQLIHTAVDWLAPRICACCGCFAEEPICSDCLPDPSNRCRGEDVCQCCAEQVAQELCPLCILAPLPLRALRSCFYYEHSVRQIVQRYKFQGYTGLSAWISEQLAQRCTDFPQPDWDVVVPLPSPNVRIRERGAIHTLPLARRLARVIERPLAANALRSSNQRRSQVGLTVSERYRNSRGAYECAPQQLSGKRVLLVDDVLTSGASIESAALALHAAGATVVDAVTFARARAFRKNRIAGRRANERDQSPTQPTGQLRTNSVIERS